MGELDDAVDDHCDQGRDQYAPTDQCQWLAPVGGGIRVRLLSVSARVVSIAVVAVDRWVLGTVIRRVVPCHGRRC